MEFFCRTEGAHPALLVTRPAAEGRAPYSARRLWLMALSMFVPSIRRVSTPWFRACLLANLMKAMKSQ